MNIHRIYAPFQRYFRARQMRNFEEMFRPTATTKIIDVGGYRFNWTLIQAEPQILMVNLEDEDCHEGRFHKVRGDGQRLAYPDDSFDIAYSNSVIEHVDDHAAFAGEIRRIARRYYVQTPNRWFPVEPHLLAVGIHLLPRRLTRRLVRWFSVWGLITKPDRSAVDRMLDSISLLDRDEMRRLFPDAEIREERFLGLVKSLIAVRL